MIQYPRKIRNFNAFVDGVSYAGRVTEGTLPKLQLSEDDHRGGGMDAPIQIDMGMEGMKAELACADWPPALIKMFASRRRMVLRPAGMGEHNTTVDTWIYTIGGRWSSLDFGTLKPNSDAPLKMEMSLDYIRCECNGSELFEIDVKAGKRVVGGVDQLSNLRTAMGY